MERQIECPCVGSKTCSPVPRLRYACQYITLKHDAAYIESSSRGGVWSDVKSPFNVKPGELVELSTTSWISFVKGS